MGSVEDNSNAVHARDVIDVLAFGPATCGVSVTRMTGGRDESLATCWVTGSLHQVRREFRHLRARAKQHGLHVCSSSRPLRFEFFNGRQGRVVFYFDLRWTSADLADYPELQKRSMHVLAEQFLVHFGCHLDPLP